MSSSRRGGGEKKPMEGEYGERRRSGWKKKKGRDGMGEKQNKNKTRLDLIRDVRAEETSQKSRFSWKCVEVVFFSSFFFHGETRWEPEKVTAEERPQCVGVPEQARLPGNASAVWLEGAWRDSALCCTAIPLWKATEVWKNLKPVVEQEKKKKKGWGHSAVEPVRRRYSRRYRWRCLLLLTMKKSFISAVCHLNVIHVFHLTRTSTRL